MKISPVESRKQKVQTDHKMLDEANEIFEFKIRLIKDSNLQKKITLNKLLTVRQTCSNDMMVINLQSPSRLRQSLVVRRCVCAVDVYKEIDRFYFKVILSFYQNF